MNAEQAMKLKVGDKVRWYKDEATPEDFGEVVAVDSSGFDVAWACARTREDFSYSQYIELVDRSYGVYFSAWQISKTSLGQLLTDAKGRGEIENTHTVWVGPTGDAVVEGARINMKDEEYKSYTDAGHVAAYI